MVGTGSIDQDNPDSNDTWSAEVTLPSNVLGSRNMWFYAHSVTGEELSMSVPVTIAP
jgi:hypothetical protein